MYVFLPMVVALDAGRPSDVVAVADGATTFHNSDEILSQTEKQRYDGWFNNLAHPEWGSVGKFTTCA